MVDVHCHLTLLEDDPGELSDLDAVITCGTSIEDSKKAIEIAEKYTNVWACAGIHPEEINKIYNVKFTIYNEMEKLIQNKKVVGIGEVGLDYYQGIGDEEKKKQIELLEIQLRLAEKYKLPVEIHNRNADEDIFQLLTAHNSLLKSGVLMHCFTRNMEFMHKMSTLGAYFSFGGLIAHTHNSRMVKVAREVPEDRLLLETDSPFGYPEFGVKAKNQPHNVKIVARVMAEIRQTTEAEIDRIATENARRLFTRII
jgi:TatD DNase family protein